MAKSGHGKRLRPSNRSARRCPGDARKSAEKAEEPVAIGLPLGVAVAPAHAPVVATIISIARLERLEEAGERILEAVIRHREAQFIPAHGGAADAALFDSDVGDAA